MTIQIVEKQGEVTDSMISDSEYILGLLSLVYPGHPWGLRVMEGGFFIQYMSVPFEKPYGMACRYKDFAQSASAMRHTIIMMAGEWLERAGLARKALDPDQEIDYVEGVPDKYQMRPFELVESIHAVPDDSNGVNIREAVRPQVVT